MDRFYFFAVTVSYFLIILQEEYFKAYYAALLKQRQEAEEAAKRQESLNMSVFDDLPSNRQVGMKSKREEDEADNDFEWEQPPISGNLGFLLILFFMTSSFKISLKMLLNLWINKTFEWIKIISYPVYRIPNIIASAQTISFPCKYTYASNA